MFKTSTSVSFQNLALYIIATYLASSSYAGFVKANNAKCPPTTGLAEKYAESTGQLSLY